MASLREAIGPSGAGGPAGYGPQLKVVMAVVGIGALALAVFAAICELRGISFAAVTRDPVAYGNLSPETGLATRIGVIVWTLAAGIALGAGFVCRRQRPRLASIAISLGALALLLAADDSLMAHELISNKLGLPLVEAAYLALLAMLLWRHWRQILAETPWMVFLAALILLGASIGIDFADDRFEFGAEAAIEDSFKFVGILMYSAYLALVVVRIAEPEQEANRPGGSRPGLT